MNASTVLKILAVVTPAGLTLAAAGCAHVEVAPIEVKPIHIVHDINIRVDKQLDDFFAFQEHAAATQASTTQPATTQAAPTTTAAAQS